MDQGSSVPKKKNGARNQSKTKGYQINGEEYKHLQRIAKHFVKERLISLNHHTTKPIKLRLNLGRRALRGEDTV
jgi:hypothetical protein